MNKNQPTAKELVAKEKQEKERQVEEDKEIVDAMEKVKVALRRMRPKTLTGNLNGYEIKFGTRSVFVVIAFKNHKWRPADDRDEIESRILSIDIGFHTNRPEHGACLSSFAEDFASFMKRNRLEYS